MGLYRVDDDIKWVEYKHKDDDANEDWDVQYPRFSDLGLGLVP